MLWQAKVEAGQKSEVGSQTAVTMALKHEGTKQIIRPSPAFQSVNPGRRIERREFRAHRRAWSRLVKASRIFGRPEHGTRLDGDGGLCRTAARHSDLAGGAGQEKQVHALAAFQWIHGRDQRWSAR